MGIPGRKLGDKTVAGKWALRPRVGIAIPAWLGEARRFSYLSPWAPCPSPLPRGEFCPSAGMWVGSHPNLTGHTARVGHLADEGRGRTSWCHTLHRTENRVPLPKLWASGRTTDFRRRVRLGPDIPLGTSPGPWGTVGVPLTLEVGIGVEHRAMQKSAFDGRGGRLCRGCLPFPTADPKLLPRTSGHPPPQSPPWSTRPEPLPPPFCT